MHQRLCSFFSSLQIMLGEVEAPSKTHAFLCFQIIQAPKIIKVFTPFLCSLLTLLIVVRHQSAKLSSFCRGTESARFSGANNLNQTYLATTHVVKRCIVSSAWSHSGHLSGWERPLLASLSAVQHLFRIANHKNILHLAGAQVFQSRRQGSKVTAPKKKALYADLEE
jgi:hypothetical protein